MGRARRRGRPAAAVALLAALGGLVVATNAPQAEAVGGGHVEIHAAQVPLLDFWIAAFTCPTDPGDVSLAAGNIPEECEPTVGAAFAVTDEDGTELAACTAGADGICVVQLPNEAAVTVTADAATLPAGYAPRENPIATEIHTEFAGALFINLPGAPLTFAIEPTAGGDGQTIAYRGEGYTPGGAVVVLMTADGLIVAEDEADTQGAIAGSFQAPDRAQLTGEATNDIPVFATDQATGRESERVIFTYAVETPTPVPAVGRPVHVHAGTCGDLASSPRYPLTDLATPAAAPEGAREATVAEASYTVIDVALDDLLAVPHAIDAHLSDEAMRAYVACGEIGGPRQADGSVVVGLREQNGSGLEGIAFLAPDPADPSQTRVSVFLAPHLAEEDRAAGTPVASSDVD